MILIHTISHFNLRYIPDISRALLVVIGKINAKEDKVLAISETAKKKSVASSSSSASSSPSGIVLSTRGRLLATISNGTLSEAVIAAKLHQAVDRCNCLRLYSQLTLYHSSFPIFPSCLIPLLRDYLLPHI